MTTETPIIFEIPETIGPSMTLITCNLDPVTCGFCRKTKTFFINLCLHPEAPKADAGSIPRNCKTKPKPEVEIKK